MIWVKGILYYGIISFLTLLMIEVSSYFLTMKDMFMVNDIPSRYLNISKETTTHYSWRTERDAWGAWHLPSSTAIHSTSCFSVLYKSNEIGARDDSFKNIKKLKNVVLLGDSFAEGWGVNLENTAQSIIEQQTGFNLLNFGAAAHLGPVQYYMIYEKLAKSYPHEAVIIFFTPNSDFTDNDYSVWRGNGSIFFNDSRDERYRPYYRENNDGKLISFIPQKAVKRDDFSTMKESWDWRVFLVKNFWFSNAWRTTKYVIERRSNNNASIGRRYVGYIDAKEKQQKAAMEYLSRIIQVAQGKPVLIVAIPTANELRYLKMEFDLGNIYWLDYLRNLASDNHSVEFLDLSNNKVDDISRLFHTCDEHWSSYGNKWAAQKISPILNELINN